LIKKEKYKQKSLLLIINEIVRQSCHKKKTGKWIVWNQFRDVVEAATYNQCSRTSADWASVLTSYIHLRVRGGLNPSNAIQQGRVLENANWQRGRFGDSTISTQRLRSCIRNSNALRACPPCRSKLQLTGAPVAGTLTVSIGLNS